MAGETYSRRNAVMLMSLAPWLSLGDQALAAPPRPWRHIAGLGQQTLIGIYHYSPTVSHPWNVTQRMVLESKATTAVSPSDKLWTPINTAIETAIYRERPPPKPGELAFDEHGVHWLLSVTARFKSIVDIYFEADGDMRPRSENLYGYVNDKAVFFRGRRLLETLTTALPELHLYGD